MQNKSIKIKLVFYFSNPGSNMSLEINGEKLIPNESQLVEYIAFVNFPTEIKLEISGKTDKDVFKDIHGNIVKDTYIELQEVYVDDIFPDYNFLVRWPVLNIGGTHDILTNNFFYSNYFGHNGIATLDFNCKNKVHWLLRTNQFRNDNWHKNEY